MPVLTHRHRLTNRFRQPPLGSRINPHHPLARGLVGLWLLNEGHGNKAQDLSGYGNEGTLTNMLPDSDWVSGRRSGYALDFDGSDDFIDINIANNDINTDLGTVMMRVRFAPTSVARPPIDIRNTSNSHQISFLWIDTDSELRYLYYEGTVNQVRSSNISDNNVWHCVAMTWDTSASEMKAYLDGKQEGATQTIPTAISGPINDSRIGAAAGTDFFLGQMNDVRIYNRVLSAQEIEQIFYNPYGIFERTQRTAYLVPAAVGGRTTRNTRQTMNRMAGVGFMTQRAGIR